MMPEAQKETRMTKVRKSQEFSPNDFVVYPAHGVGKIVSSKRVIIFDRMRSELRI